MYGDKLGEGEGGGTTREEEEEEGLVDLRLLQGCSSTAD